MTKPKVSLEQDALERLITSVLASTNAEDLLKVSDDIGLPTTASELRDAVNDLARSRGIDPEALWKGSRSTAEAKDLKRRWKLYSELLAELVASERLLRGESRDDDGARLLQLCLHAESLWDDACLLFREGRFPRAIAIALAAVEELGKVAVARHQFVLNEVRRRGGSYAGIVVDAEVTGEAMSTTTNSRPKKRRKSKLVDHNSKHTLAAGAGALVNSRLDRIVGLDAVIRFLDMVERGELDRFRQSCYYADMDAATGAMQVPQASRTDAQFYVVLAGELLLEVASASGFTRLLRRVERFERSIGHPWAHAKGSKRDFDRFGRGVAKWDRGLEKKSRDPHRG